MFGPDIARSAPARRCREEPGRSAADAYMAGLGADLGITENQTAAWAEFAEVLRSNRRRMRAVDSHPFGAEQDRLAALVAMRQAARPLFARLNASQQQSARKLLPLCCQLGIDPMSAR
jgi:hypothetical protein